MEYVGEVIDESEAAEVQYMRICCRRHSWCYPVLRNTCEGKSD